MKTLALISALIISGMLLVANYQKDKNNCDIKNNNFINAMWDESTALYSNDYFTLSQKYKPGAYEELSHSIFSDIEIAFYPENERTSISYTSTDKTYYVDRSFIRFAEK